MKESLSRNKNLIIIGSLIALVVFAGYFYSTRDTSSDELLTTASATSTVDGDLLPVLLQLRRLKLDDSLFRGQAWSSFNDFSKPLSPQAPGRQNPFAPLPADSSVFSSTTASR